MAQCDLSILRKFDWSTHGSLWFHTVFEIDFCIWLENLHFWGGNYDLQTAMPSRMSMVLSVSTLTLGNHLCILNVINDLDNGLYHELRQAIV